MNIIEIRAQIETKKTELRALEAQLHDAMIAESSFKVGQIYTHTFDYGSRRGIVQRGQITGFRKRYGKTRPVITLFKADGALGKRVQEIWSFEENSWKLESSP